MKIKLEELKNLSRKALIKYGYNDEDAEVILGMLMYAQLRGNNQGIVKLIGKGLPKHKDAKEMTIEKESPATALINCNLTMEALAMDKAVEMVTSKAKELGIAIVGTRNGSGSSGAIGYWSRQVADTGLIGITMSSYPYNSVPPYGSYEAMFSTNPIAWGVPSEDESIVLDMSSSAIAYYGLVEAKTKGVKLSEKLGWDNEGKETNDPEAIMEGAIMPFDKGFKGAGLAMMVHIIGGTLVGADFRNASDNDGNVIMAINPEFFVGVESFKKEIEEIKEAVKNAKKLPEVEEIMVPGERGDKVRAQIEETGHIEVEDNLLKELREFVGE